MARKETTQAAAPAAEVAVAPRGGVLPARLMGASWVLLLAACGTALLTDSPGWFGLKRPFFRSGPYLLQAYAAQILVMAALGCFAWALWSRRTPLRWHPSLLLVLGLLGWTCLSTALSPSPASAVLGLSINSQGLLLRIVATTWLLLIVELADGTARIRTMARGIAVVGALTAVVGLLQVAGINPLGDATAWGVGRSFGTLGNPDMFGDFVVFSLFVSLGVALSEKRLPWRVAMLTANALCAASAVTSYSRAAWLAIVVGTVVFLLLTARSLLRFDRRLMVAVAAVVLVVGAFTAVRHAEPGSPTDVSKRLTSAFDLNDPNTAVRLEAWSEALRAVALRPLFGYGPDTMVLASQPVRSERFSRLEDPAVVLDSAHDLPLQTMSELGVPGFLLWAGMLVSIGVVSIRLILRGPESASGLRLVLAGMGAAYAAYMVDSLFTPSSVAGILFRFCALGLFVAPLASGRAFVTPPSRRALAVGLGALAATGIVVAASFIAADLQATAAVDGDRPMMRVASGARAVMLNPLSVDYAVVNGWALADEAEALAEAGAGRTDVRAYADRALAEARRAVTLEPTSPRRRVFLAQILLVGARLVDAGMEAQALAEYETAIRMSPNDLQTRYEYAQRLEPRRAIPVLEGIVSEDPGYVSAVVDLCKLRVASGDIAGAKRILEDALATPLTPAQRKQLEPGLALIP